MPAHVMPMQLDILCRMFDNFPDWYNHLCSSCTCMGQRLNHSAIPPTTLAVLRQQMQEAWNYVSGWYLLYLQSYVCESTCLYQCQKRMYTILIWGLSTVNIPLILELVHVLICICNILVVDLILSKLKYIQSVAISFSVCVYCCSQLFFFICFITSSSSTDMWTLWIHKTNIYFGYKF